MNHSTNNDLCHNIAPLCLLCDACTVVTNPQTYTSNGSLEFSFILKMLYLRIIRQHFPSADTKQQGVNIWDQLVNVLERFTAKLCSLGPSIRTVVSQCVNSPLCLVQFKRIRYFAELVSRTGILVLLLRLLQ